MFYSGGREKKQCVFFLFCLKLRCCTLPCRSALTSYSWPRFHIHHIWTVFFKQTHQPQPFSPPMMSPPTRRAAETPPSDFLSIPSRKAGAGRPRSQEQGKIVCQLRGGYHMATDCARVQQAITNQTFLLRCLKMPFKLLQCWASFRRKILSGW